MRYTIKFLNMGLGLCEGFSICAHGAALDGQRDKPDAWRAEPLAQLVEALDGFGLDLVAAGLTGGPCGKSACGGDCARAPLPALANETFGVRIQSGARGGAWRLLGCDRSVLGGGVRNLAAHVDAVVSLAADVDR